MKITKMRFLLLVIFVYNITTEKTCGNFIPQTKEDCNAMTTSFRYCCFFYIPNGTSLSNGCVSMTISDFTNFGGSRTINGQKYTYDCGMTYTNNAIKQCGNGKPNTSSDCNQFSTHDSSCCYYNFFGQKGCIDYGAVVQGSIPYGSMVLQCEGQIYTISLYMAIIFLFILL
jgi:hypothetical protein